jgi:hypothetical protein
MALDKNFLKYKLERIKNKRIFKDQDSETKKQIRKDNAKLAAEEADAIHSYLTGEDEIDALDNKSYLENRLPGSLFLNPQMVRVGRRMEWQGNLNVREVQTNPKTKKSKLSQLLKKFKTVANANIDEAKKVLAVKRIFDKLNIILGTESIKFDGDLEVNGNIKYLGTIHKDGVDPEQSFRLGPNGYTYLPNGILIQWGVDTRNSDQAYVIEFPIAFPNGCFSVTVNRQAGNDDGDNKIWAVTATGITSTGFTIDRHDDISGEQTINYMAIGN